MLVRQSLDRFLFRKTCGASSRSDETGCRLVYDLGAGGLYAVADGKARDVIALAEDGDFLSFEHGSGFLRTIFLGRIRLEDEGYPIVKLGEPVQEQACFGQDHDPMGTSGAKGA